MANSNPLFVVLNAGAGPADAALTRSAIHAVFEAAGRRHQFLPVTDASELPAVALHALALARQHHGAVIAAGGDGTSSAVAQVVLGSAIPFGVLPCGTFNYFARAHGVPQDLTQAAQALLHATVRPVQVGLINDRPFLVNASLGLYPRLLEDREAYKRQFGRSRLVALGAGLMTLLRDHRTLILQLEQDGAARTLRTSTLFTGNNLLQLETLGIPEAALVEHGKLVAIMVRPLRPLAMLGLLLRGALGQLGAADNVLSFAFSSLTVRPRLPYGRRRIKVAMDGEVTWLSTPLVLRVAPQPLLLLTPAAEGDAA